MASQVQLYNLAIAHLGISLLVQDVNETTQQAIQCGLWFDVAAEELMTRRDWAFASKRQVLAELASPPANWNKKYAYPSDCLKARQIVISGERDPRKAQRIPFEVSTEATQRVLYTDQSTAELIYTARIATPDLYPPAFAVALSWRLAELVGPSLATQPAFVQRAQTMAEQSYLAAAAADGNEGESGPEPDGDFLSARNG